eukprot:PLAT11916.2.p1 GENE.PLAT11916.2~~PLAT11916.2.p1  ORF type:complete len:658 (+),score=189.96 PLAT11916.2:47-2020(+)
MGACFSASNKLYAEQPMLLAECEATFTWMALTEADIQRLYEVFQKTDRASNEAVSCEDMCRLLAIKRNAFVDLVFQGVTGPYTTRLGFLEFVLMTWMYCSLDIERLYAHIFELFELNKRESIRGEELWDHITALHDGHLGGQLGSYMEKHVYKADLVTASELFGMQLACPIMLLPATTLQKKMRTKIGGEALWLRLTALRMDATFRDLKKLMGKHYHGQQLMPELPADMRASAEEEGADDEGDEAGSPSRKGQTADSTRRRPKRRPSKFERRASRVAAAAGKGKAAADGEEGGSADDGAARRGLPLPSAKLADGAEVAGADIPPPTTTSSSSSSATDLSSRVPRRRPSRRHSRRHSELKLRRPSQRRSSKYGIAPELLAAAEADAATAAAAAAATGSITPGAMRRASRGMAIARRMSRRASSRVAAESLTALAESTLTESSSAAAPPRMRKRSRSVYEGRNAARRRLSRRMSVRKSDTAEAIDIEAMAAAVRGSAVKVDEAPRDRRRSSVMALPTLPAGVPSVPAAASPSHSSGVGARRASPMRRRHSRASSSLRELKEEPSSFVSEAVSGSAGYSASVLASSGAIDDGTIERQMERATRMEQLQRRKSAALAGSAVRRRSSRVSSLRRRSKALGTMDVSSLSKMPSLRGRMGGAAS